MASCQHETLWPLNSLFFRKSAFLISIGSIASFWSQMKQKKNTSLWRNSRIVSGVGIRLRARFVSPGRCYGRNDAQQIPTLPPGARKPKNSFTFAVPNLKLACCGRLKQVAGSIAWGLAFLRELGRFSHFFNLAKCLEEVVLVLVWKQLDNKWWKLAGKYLSRLLTGELFHVRTMKLVKSSGSIWQINRIVLFAAWEVFDRRSK